MSAVVAVLGAGAAAGLNAYATLLVLGVLVRLEAVPFHDPVARFFAQDWVLAVLAALYALEFLADKVPAVEHAWGAVHTFIRPLAGAVVAVAVAGGTREGWVVLAAVAGGATSLLTHTAKTGGRLLTTVSTGGVVNPAISVAEDAAAFAGAALAMLLPWLLAAIVLATVARIFLKRRERRAVAR